MSQNFGNYGGPPQSSHGPTGQAFEGLSGSIIYPGASAPMQHNYHQAWPGTQGWQNHGQDTYNYGSQYQASKNDARHYFPNQQDFVPFDQSVTYYENDNTTTNMALSRTMAPPTQSEDEVGSNTNREEMQTRLQDLTKHSPLSRQTTETQSQIQTQNGVADIAASKSDAGALTDRAAELRARLLAKRGSTPATPSNTTDKSIDPIKTKTNNPKAPLEQPDSIQASALLAEKTSNGSMIKKTTEIKPVDQRPAGLVKPTTAKVNTRTDIDGLFAEARAAVAAGSTKSAVKNRKHDFTGKSNAEELAKPLKPNNELEKTHEEASEIGQQGLRKRNSSSEMSEPGEIRSDSKPVKDKVEKAADVPKVASAVPQNKEVKEKDKGRSVEEQPKRPAETKNVFTHQTMTPTKDHGIEEVPSPKQLKPATSAKSSSSVNLLPQPRDQAQNLRADNHQSRHERPLIVQESRKDYEQDRRRESLTKERNNGPRPEGYDSWGQPDRDRSTYTRANENRRPQPYKHDVEESARAAAEYKRELEARRLQAAQRDADRAGEKSEPVKGHHKRGIEETQPPGLKTRGPEPQSHVANHHNKEYITTINGSDERVRNAPNELSDQDSKVKVQDVRDWLELTGYFDDAYRTKVLGRFQKIKALELQKATLEREAQLEIEGRSYFARAQSAVPRESMGPSASQSSISPQVLRSSISSMPPPPPPAREVDDVGIKIKDSASRESLSNILITEDESRSSKKYFETAKTPTQTLKRPHVEDDTDFASARPAGKMSRGDLSRRADGHRATRNSAAIDEEPRFSENWVTRNGASRTNEQGVRSRSVDSQNRSLSPIRGRMTKYDSYIPSSQSRSSPARKNGVSDHQAISAVKFKNGEGLWCRNCEQSGHLARDCHGSAAQPDGGPKEVSSYSHLQASPYNSRRSDIKKEREQEIENSEERQASSSRQPIGYYQQYQPNSQQGHSRGGKSGYSAINYGVRKLYRSNEGNQDSQNNRGGDSLNLKAGGQS